MKTHKVKNENVYDMIRGLSNYELKDKSVAQVNNSYNSSSDVFHIDTSLCSLKDIVLPKSIESEIKDVLYEHKFKIDFERINLFPTNKILLEGEPGCGKTMIAYALSNLLKRELKIINLSRIVSPHLGETANNISNIFNKYNNDKYILFLDEFDIIGRLRGDSNNDHNEMKRIVNSLLQLIDYFPSEGILIFATNDIDIIDKALIRRMDRVLNIPLPSLSGIKKFLINKISLYSRNTNDINYSELAKKYKGLSFSAIDNIVKKCIKSHVITQKKKRNNKIILTNDIFI